MLFCLDNTILARFSGSFAPAHYQRPPGIRTATFPLWRNARQYTRLPPTEHEDKRMIACWREAFTHFALLYEVTARQFWASRACHIGGDALVCRVGQKAGRGAPATSAEASAALTGYSSLREAAQALSFQGTGIRSYPKWVKTPCFDVRYFREQAALWHECSHRVTQIICLLGNLTCSAAAIRGCPDAPIPGALRSRGLTSGILLPERRTPR
jgi:hypothetical protein